MQVGRSQKQWLASNRTVNKEANANVSSRRNHFVEEQQVFMQERTRGNKWCNQKRSYSPTPSEMPKKKKKKREKTKNPHMNNPITVIVLSLFANKAVHFVYQ